MNPQQYPEGTQFHTYEWRDPKASLGDTQDPTITVVIAYDLNMYAPERLLYELHRAATTIYREIAEAHGLQYGWLPYNKDTK